MNALAQRSTPYVDDVRASVLAQRAQVQTHLRVLTADLFSATASQLAEGTLANHPADEASDMYVAESLWNEIQRISDDLVSLDDTLSRMDRGDWGICAACHEPIDPARLRALPTATHCLRCQIRREG
jgi:DnaK suppressor protein